MWPAGLIGGRVWCSRNGRHPRFRCAGSRAYGRPGPDRHHGDAGPLRRLRRSWRWMCMSGTVASALDAESGELRRKQLAGRSEQVAEFDAVLKAPVRATYGAGPTGFATARRLEAAGIDCLVRFERRARGQPALVSTLTRTNHDETSRTRGECNATSPGGSSALRAARSRVVRALAAVVVR